MLSNPKAGDVVVFLPNNNKNEHYYVKRVIAVPGDTVVIKNGVCYVNGEVSPYVNGTIEQAGIAANEIVVENSSFFCVGDDLDNSEDSRSANIGLLKGTDILGKAWLHAKYGYEKMGMIK